VIDEIGDHTLAVDKVAYSALVHTPLGWWLRVSNIGRVVICGIVTNGGVASTVRAAHVEDLDVTVATDACAAFDSVVHQATLTSLGSVVHLATTAEIVSGWE
jgi:nicotinamidase-related amidase